MPSFLQASYLAGLAALAVPILIHLFFRLRTKRVELGTIRFLRVVLEENARRRKVMRWLLLALRMAFVALLAALFARPFFTAAATDGNKELVVILIDQSATMQLRGDDGRLIDQAVSEAKKLIESAGRETRFEVAFFDHDVHPLTAGNLKNQQPTTKMSITSDELLGKLQAPATTFGATNFGAVFAWARDICVKAPAGVKQLHLFTDLQRSGLDWREVEPLPDEVRSHLHDLGRSVVNNVAVTEVRTPRLWVRPGESPTIRASVMHGGAFVLEEVAIVLEIGRVQRAPSSEAKEAQGRDPNGEIARRTDFAKLAERITKRERVKLEPGATVTLDFELPVLTEGLWQGRVAVEYNDDLPFDNQRFFAISAMPPYRVLVLHGEPTGTSIASETYFLEAALRLAIEGDSYSESPFAPTMASITEGASLPDLSGFDAIILANLANVARPDAIQLASFAGRGGGLLVFTGDTVSAQNCSTLTDAGLTVGEIGETKVAIDLPWRLNQWDQSHPIFEPLSDPQHGDLRRLIFAAYTQITPFPETTVLAQFDTGDPAVLERRIGAGVLLWVTTSCGRDWSDWCRSRLFLPTLHQLLGYEVGLTSGGRVRTRLVDRERLPSAQSLEVRGQTSDGGWMTADPLSPGVEQFESFAQVINTNPRESETDRCPRQEFEDRFAVKFVDDENSSLVEAAALGNVEFQRDELWHWVAGVLLAILLLEGFVGNRTTA